MSWHQALYAAPLYIIMFLVLAFLGVAWRRRSITPHPGQLLLLILGVAWALLAALETSCTTEGWAIFWCQLQLVVICPIPCAISYYTINYIDHPEWLSRRNRILMCIIPSVFLLLVLTNSWHGLVVRHRELKEIGDFLWLDKSYGPVFFAFALYMGLFMLDSCLLIIRRIIQGGLKFYFRQPLFILICFMFMGIGGALQIFWVPFYNIAGLFFLLFTVMAYVFLAPLRRRDVMPVVWELVVNGMDDALLVLDDEDRIVDMNPAALSLLGTSRSQGIGAKIDGFWPGAVWSLADLLASPRSSHEVALSSKGEQRTFDLKMSALRDALGAVVSRVLVLRDITERQEAQAAMHRYRDHLEELVAERTQNLQVANAELEQQIMERQRTQQRLEVSEQKFVSLFEHAPMPYYLSDLAGRFLDGNRAAQELIGYDKDALIGQSLLDLPLLSKVQMPRAAKLLAENILGNNTGPDEFVLSRFDGSKVPVEINTSPIKIGSQTVVLGAVHDLTSRKASEAALQQANAELEQQIAQRQRTQERLELSEERFMMLFEHAPMAYFILNTKGGIIDGNKAAQEIIGYTRTELVGRNFLELQLIGRTQLPRALKMLAQNALGRQTSPEEFVLTRSSGQEVPAEVNTRPMTIDGQSVVLGAVHDLRQRKKWEAALQQAHGELEQRVRDRTAELASTNRALFEENAERQRAEEKLRVSLTEKEVLLKEIHHRVKNNLQIISSLLSLQAGDLDDPRMLALFAESEHRVRSMALIHEMLYRSDDLARINFHDYADDLVHYLYRVHQSALGRVGLHCDADDVMLEVDQAVPCGLILNELVLNCFKHAFPDGREGNITVSIHGDGDGGIQMSVADDGVGLPEGFCLEESTSLGMQLVCSLTEQLDGKLELVGGHGTTARWAFGP